MPDAEWTGVTGVSDPVEWWPEESPALLRMATGHHLRGNEETNLAQLQDGTGNRAKQ